MNRSHIHEYSARIIWDGNLGNGTADYSGYSRAYHIEMRGKPSLLGSSDVAFRGDAGRHNPEDLLVAALSSCHMLAYLALCARSGVCAIAYNDEASGVLQCNSDGGGRFTEVALRPRVTISDAGHESLARQLHDTAHERCFIASSCNVPIRLEVEIVVGAASATPNADVSVPS